MLSLPCHSNPEETSLDFSVFGIFSLSVVPPYILSIRGSLLPLLTLAQCDSSLHFPSYVDSPWIFMWKDGLFLFLFLPPFFFFLPFFQIIGALFSSASEITFLMSLALWTYLYVLFVCSWEEPEIGIRRPRSWFWLCSTDCDLG